MYAMKRLSTENSLELDQGYTPRQLFGDKWTSYWCNGIGSLLTNSFRYVEQCHNVLADLYVHIKVEK